MNYPEEVKTALEAMQEAKNLKDQADILRKSAIEILLPYYTTNALTRIPYENVNIDYVKESKAETTDLKKFKDALLQSGVDAVTIHQCHLAATKVTSKGATLKALYRKRDK